MTHYRRFAFVDSFRGGVLRSAFRFERSELGAVRPPAAQTVRTVRERRGDAWGRIR